jgi:Tfp pilus assembly protein PilW
MDELYNDVGTRSVSVPTDYDFYLVRVGASANESMIVTIIDTNPTRYKYVSTHSENFSLTFIIQYNSTSGYIDYTQIGLSGWDSNVGYIFKVYGIKL